MIFLVNFSKYYQLQLLHVYFLKKFILSLFCLMIRIVNLMSLIFFFCFKYPLKTLYWFFSWASSPGLETSSCFSFWFHIILQIVCSLLISPEFPLLHYILSRYSFLLDWLRYFIVSSISTIFIFTGWNLLHLTYRYFSSLQVLLFTFHVFLREIPVGSSVHYRSSIGWGLWALNFVLGSLHLWMTLMKFHRIRGWNWDHSLHDPDLLFFPHDEKAIWAFTLQIYPN